MTRLVPLLISILSFASGARADHLAQLSFEGRVSTAGGGRIEVSIGARRTQDDVARQVDLGLHLAEGTSAADLTALIALRLEAAGILVLRPAPSDPDSTLTHLFVERAIFVQIRAGFGLKGTISSCENAPVSMRVLSSDALQAPAQLLISASTWHPHTERASSARLVIELEQGMHGSGVAEQLFLTATQAGWIGTRPSVDEWSPARMTEGARVRGMSICMDSPADWGLRVDIDERP